MAGARNVEDHELIYSRLEIKIIPNQPLPFQVMRRDYGLAAGLLTSYVVAGFVNEADAQAFITRKELDAQRSYERTRAELEKIAQVFTAMVKTECTPAMAGVDA